MGVAGRAGWRPPTRPIQPPFYPPPLLLTSQGELGNHGSPFTRTPYQCATQCANQEGANAFTFCNDPAGCGVGCAAYSRGNAPIDGSQDKKFFGPFRDFEKSGCSAWLLMRLVAGWGAKGRQGPLRRQGRGHMRRQPPPPLKPAPSSFRQGRGPLSLWDVLLQKGGEHQGADPDRPRHDVGVGRDDQGLTTA